MIFLLSSLNIGLLYVFTFLPANMTLGYVHSFVSVATPSSSSADKEPSENIIGGGGLGSFKLLWTGFFDLGGSLDGGGADGLAFGGGPVGRAFGSGRSCCGLDDDDACPPLPLRLRGP